MFTYVWAQQYAAVYQLSYRSDLIKPVVPAQQRQGIIIKMKEAQPFKLIQ
jgi:hypothetical protein